HRRGPAERAALEPGGLHAQRDRDGPRRGELRSTMTPRTARRTARFLVLAALAAAATATLAKPVTYTRPGESSTLKKTDAPGYLRAEAQCVSCHSRDYITTQPPGKGKEFWAAEVNKMITVYGAPIPEPDRAPLVDYLAATY